MPTELVNEFEKAISLRIIDTYWMEHINTMSHLREGIGLPAYRKIGKSQKPRIVFPVDAIAEFMILNL